MLKRLKCFGIISVWISIIVFCSCKKVSGGATQKESDPPPVPGNFNNVVGIDHFGRTFSPITGNRANKKVGLFFWLWIGQPYASAIYDATKILALPDGLRRLTDFDYQDETISPNGQAHFWGEPIWGYYNSEDQWVMRKQIEMLTIAGIDFIYFDATNAFIYKNVFLKLLGIIDEYQKNGFNPPRIVFYTHSRSLQTTRELYKELYQPGHFPDTWFRVNGKPLIIAYTNPEDDANEAKSRGDNDYKPGILSPEILNFFHFYRPQWPSDPVYADGFPWIEWIHPQPMHNGIMNVTVASHPNVPMSFSLTRPNEMTNWGRGWNPLTKKNIAEDVDRGTFFQTQWDYAIAADPDMISIGGWNEWIAYKQPYWNEYVLVDAVNKEYSRDIEPMKGGYKDAFFIQLIANLRKYKAIQGTIPSPPKVTINILQGEQQWKDIPFTGININTNRFNRDEYGASTQLRYTQPAPQNLIREIKVAHDDKNIYFFIRARNAIKAPVDHANRIQILIGRGEPSLKGWEGYEYIIGKNYETSTTSVEKFSAGYQSVDNGTAKFNITDNLLQIECPRSAIDAEKGGKFYFKVATDVREPDDIMSYYTSGSVMPIGRLSYMYNMGN